MALLRFWGLEYIVPQPSSMQNPNVLISWEDAHREFAKVSQFMLDEKSSRIDLEGAHLKLRGNIYRDELNRHIDGEVVDSGFLVSIEKIKMSRSAFLARAKDRVYEITLEDAGDTSWMDAELAKKAQRASKTIAPSDGLLRKIFRL